MRFGRSCMVVGCGSETGIGLGPRCVVGIFVPSLALSVQNIYIALLQPSLVITESFHEGHPEAPRNVPCDVAVHPGNIESATVFLDTKGASRGAYSQAPGLSVLNARSIQPAAGSMATSRLTGLFPFNLEASNEYLVCVAGAESGERPTTRKSCPCVRQVSRVGIKLRFEFNLRGDELDVGD